VDGAIGTITVEVGQSLGGYLVHHEFELSWTQKSQIFVWSKIELNPLRT